MRIILLIFLFISSIYSSDCCTEYGKVKGSTISNNTIDEGWSRAFHIPVDGVCEEQVPKPSKEEGVCISEGLEVYDSYSIRDTDDSVSDTCEAGGETYYTTNYNYNIGYKTTEYSCSCEESDIPFPDRDESE